MGDESEGTQKLFALSAPLIDTLKKGKTLVVDELDSKLHPMIMRFINVLFHSTETNPNNAQLIFATHDTNLLNQRFFRRDQICFTEKDQYGSTDLYSLADYEWDEDSENSYKRDYFKGKYFIGELFLEKMMARDKPFTAIDYDTSISRKQYQDMLSALLKKPYQKNSETMYEDLQKSGGKQEDAINHAKTLLSIYGNKTDYADQNPSTTVHELVIALNDYLN